MKRLTSYSCIFLSGALSSCKTHKNSSALFTPSYNSYKYYTVKDIDSINNYYIIYMTDDERQYQIISKKEKNCNCDPIAVGYKYLLLLSKDLSAPTAAINTYDLKSCIKVEGTEICRAKNMCGIFYAENLKGLCLKL